jgi:hypothetical protein
MLTKLRKVVYHYLNSDKQFPTVMAIGSGLYPMLYCFSGNFSLFNSIEHLLFFLLVFIGLPILVFNATHWLLKTVEQKNYSAFIFSFLNVFAFLFFIKTITYSGAQLKKTLVIIIVAVLIAMFLKKHIKKLVLLQYLLAVVSFIGLIFIIFSNLNISNDWQNQPDNIADVTFKKKPNVYFIQPDGYVNFSELKGGFYNYDNSRFESFLSDNGFTSYPSVRSNYSTTLSSNSSFFMMKHHYFNNRISDFELYNARDMIISKNPVLDVFKNNGYKTYYVSETDYLLFNRPKMGYDYCNIGYFDFPFIRPGISEPIDINAEIETTVSEIVDQPKFFFIHLLSPWHIKTKQQASSNNKDIERENWLTNLETANIKLTKTINLIKQKDQNALIIIMADHGGYVGFDYGNESEVMTQNRDLIYSIFSNQLSIHWPNNDVPDFNNKFKSSVNVFRLLFSHLSEDDSYSKQLQPDESYKVLRQGIDIGIYKYIDKDGNITLEEHQ